jgi:2-oxoglutarate dehydrogenase complex dehydrogenase (E1) component-like enzyme
VTSTLAEEAHTIKDVEDYLNKLYCSSVGVEFEHIQSEDERLWLYENYETTMKEQFTPAEKVKMVQLLVRTEEMEKLQQKRFATHKRYSSEGSESITVALNSILAEASLINKENPDQGIEYAVLGMPHRGRLATLVVINDYPMRNLLYKIKGNNDIPAEIIDRVDDIPTHIAVSNTKKFTWSGADSTRNKDVTLTMVHNPSHLESQNSISMGKTRAKIDDYQGNFEKNWGRVLNL